MIRWSFILVLLTFSCNTKKTFDHSHFLLGVSRGIIDNPEIDEASGLAASIKNPGHLWVHNDSGDDARLFLINEDAHCVATVYLQGVNNRDWEDMAVAPCGSSSCIYVGEIGDNSADDKFKYIFRFEEPDIHEFDSIRTIERVDKIKFVLADKPRDSEAMFVDPITQDIYLFSKRDKGKIKCYQLSFPQSFDVTDTAQLVAELPIKPVVAADISPLGDEVLIKTYRQVFYFERKDSETIPQMLTRGVYTSLPYAAESQGEAVAFASDNRSYFTLSEVANGQKPHLMYFQRIAE